MLFTGHLLYTHHWAGPFAWSAVNSPHSEKQASFSSYMGEAVSGAVRSPDTGMAQSGVPSAGLVNLGLVFLICKLEGNKIRI